MTSLSCPDCSSPMETTAHCGQIEDNGFWGHLAVCCAPYEKGCNRSFMVRLVDGEPKYEPLWQEEMSDV